MHVEERGIQPGPIATFPSWKDKGRYVRNGKKALVLCMPITCKRREADPPSPEATQGKTFTRFIVPNY